MLGCDEVKGVQQRQHDQRASMHICIDACVIASACHLHLLKSSVLNGNGAMIAACRNVCVFCRSSSQRGKQRAGMDL